MPFIDVKLSCELEESKELTLKTELGKAICLIPGKSEGSLMVQFSENCHLWFNGKQEGPIAMVNVMVYGAADPASYRAFSEAVIPVFEKELGAKKVYLKFEEVQNWF